MAVRAGVSRAVVLAAGAGVLAAGMLAVAGPAPAQAAAVLYAYAGGTAVSPSSCPQDTASPPVPSAECSLADALSAAAAADTIALATAGGTAHYVGNWTVSTSGTSAAAPVTIEAAPGLPSQPVLDGNNGASSGCTTTSCAGPVLTIPQGEYAALSGITIENGNNTTISEGGGLDNSGVVTIAGSTFTGNAARNGGAIDNGDQLNRGASVTITESTFSGNSVYNDGGAIDNGDTGGGGSVTVAASTFSGNTAGYFGGAIDSGDDSGSGSVTVTTSTFSGNGATHGGAIDIGDNGHGSVTVTTSTFSGNAATHGGAIDSGDGVGFGSVMVAGDVFDGSCDQASGSWTDGGYNVGSDGSCFNGGTADLNAGSSSSLDLGSLAANGGPTQTILPAAGSPVIGIIPDPTTVTLGSAVALCPATDQRGYASAKDASCDAGAVQTSSLVLTGVPDPAQAALSLGPVTLADSAVLSGGFSPTGTITFTLYAPSGGGAVYTDVVTVSGDHTYTTYMGNNPGGYSAAVPGTYQWDISYSGDTNNNQFSDTGDPGEQVAVKTAQAITFSAPPASAVVNDTYLVSATGGGSGNPVNLAIASGSAAVCSLTGSTVTFTSPGDCEIDATQDGNSQYAPGSSSQDVPVGPAATTTSVTVQPATITATVQPVPPGGVAPSGTVAFSVDGSQVGTAGLSDGTATLTYSVPPGATHSVAAVYGGDTNFTGSSESTSRQDPSITAAVSSTYPETSYGWYRSPVTVTFTCTPHGAALTATCPAPRVLTSNGAGQSVTETITAVDGGAATVTVSPINIDQTAPVIRIHGAVSGKAYDAPGPAITCTAKVLSGLAGPCTLTLTRTPAQVSWHASVTSKAGVTATSAGHITLIDFYVAGANYKNGMFAVTPGHTYRVVAYVTGQTAPRYVDATPAGTRPHPVGPALRKAGKGMWAIRLVIITRKTRRHRYWNAGILVGPTLHLIPLRVLKN